jgi:Sensors of blue-light using FAD
MTLGRPCFHVPGPYSIQVPDMPSLIHLIYASAATSRMNEQDLAQLLQCARDNNTRLGLTGMLLHANGSFFQVLEGPADIVTKLYQTIECDERHEQVTRIISEPIPRRFFKDWSMGFSDLSGGPLAQALGTNDFFGQAHSFNDVSYGRAKKLLAAFAAGRWRSAHHAAQPSEACQP